MALLPDELELLMAMAETLRRDQGTGTSFCPVVLVLREDPEPAEPRLEPLVLVSLLPPRALVAEVPDGVVAVVPGVELLVPEELPPRVEPLLPPELLEPEVEVNWMTAKSIFPEVGLMMISFTVPSCCPEVDCTCAPVS